VATTATVSASELCDILGLSRTKLSELAASGTIVRVSRGRFDLRRSIQQYCESQRRVISHLDDISREARAASLTASAGLKERQRELIEWKLRRESGKWCLVEHVTQQWRANAIEFKTWALSLPPRIRNELDLTAAQLAAIENIIDDGLRRLSALDDGAAMSEAAE